MRFSYPWRASFGWEASYLAEPMFSPLMWQIWQRMEPLASSTTAVEQPGNAHRLPETANNRFTVGRDGSERLACTRDFLCRTPLFPLGWPAPLFGDFREGFFRDIVR